jgi:hypothetical protein
MAAKNGVGLMEQDLSALDVTKLTPLSPEVISRQATINIGTKFSMYCFKVECATHSTRAPIFLREQQQLAIPARPACSFLDLFVFADSSSFYLKHTDVNPL